LPVFNKILPLFVVFVVVDEKIKIALAAAICLLSLEQVCDWSLAVLKV